MHLPDSHSSDHGFSTLQILQGAMDDPERICREDPLVQQAFEDSLRGLAQDILTYHPGLAHLLIGMSGGVGSFVHGQN